VDLLLVDSSKIFRMGLRTALADASVEGDLTVVAECGDGSQACEIAVALAPDVVVTDFHLPDRNGIALARELGRIVPTARVLLLAPHGPEAIVYQALRAGAGGYALKEQSPGEIVAAIRAVGRGELVLPPGIRAPASGSSGHKSRNGLSQPIERLSQRERQVFDLVVWGSSNKQIAERLGISVKTVETHRGHINGKLLVHTSADIVRLASLWGMLTPFAAPTEVDSTHTLVPVGIA
jgi:DNA-binding NarL/FixJ family response regulator